MDHVGIDVLKKESQVCILEEDGGIIEKRIRTLRERFAEVSGGRPKARILVESSTESEWVARCLESLGHPPRRYLDGARIAPPAAGLQPFPI